MPQAATVEAPDELDQFVQSFKTAAPKPSSDDDDELDSFVKQQQSSSPQQSTGSKIATPDIVAARANKDGTSTGKAVENLRAEGYTTAPFPKTDARSHDFGWSKDDSGNWTQDPDVAARDSAKSTIPITPFQGTVPTTPLDQRAANLGQPSIQLQPPPTDTTQVPLNVFTNTPQAPGMPTQEELPAKAPPPPPQSPMDQMIDQEQGFEDKAHQQGDALVSKLSTGSKKVPLPYMAPDGSLRTMKLGDFQKLASDYLDDPSIPKSRGAAFAAGAAADTVSTLNDIFFSPLGMASSVTGLAAARALQTAGKQGTAAIKLAQEYQEMKNAGASADELAGQEQLVRQAVAATARTQSIVAGAETAQKASGVGFGMQGANQFITGVQKRDWSQAAAGLASMAIGGSEGLRGLNSEGISEGVKARTAEMAVDNLKNEGEPAAKVPVAPPGEKNVTAQGSHEIIHQAQLPAPAEEAAPAEAVTAPRPTSDQAATPAPVGAGEELTPEKPETLKAQVDALADGTNPIVYIPKGQTNAPEPPSGTQVTEVGGDKPGAGTYYHDDSITPQEIKASVKDGTYGKLLGNVQTKHEAIAGSGSGSADVAPNLPAVRNEVQAGPNNLPSTAPVAVTARSEDGTEIQSSLVAGDSPEKQTEQSDALKAKFPTAQISVETPEQVVQGRKSSPQDTAERLYKETDEQLKNPNLSGYHRAQLLANQDLYKNVILDKFKGEPLSKEDIAAMSNAKPGEKLGPALENLKAATEDLRLNREYEESKQARQSTAIQKPSVIDLNKPIPDDVARILNKRIGQANGGTPPFPLSEMRKLTTGQVLQGFGKVGLDEEVLRESASALHAAGYRQIGHIKITGEGLELPASGESTTSPIDLTRAESRETPQLDEGPMSHQEAINRDARKGEFKGTPQILEVQEGVGEERNPQVSIVFDRRLRAEEAEKLLPAQNNGGINISKIGNGRYAAQFDFHKYSESRRFADAAKSRLSQIDEGETPQIDEGDESDIDTFVQRHREASSVIQPQAEELSALGGKLKHIDPHVADALNGLADGRYFSREDLLKIAGGIRDAKTSADLRSIVNEFSERKATPSAATASAAKAETASSSKGSEAPSSAAQPVPEHAEQVRERTEGVREGASENGNQLGPQDAPAKVGDYVTAKSNKLGGKKMRVTSVGATGVYGQESDGGPIRFLKTGDFGPLLDSEGQPITTGPGTPLRDAFDTAGTRIQQLADVIRENVAGSKPINERMDYADKMAESQAKAKDETSAALGKVKGAMAAMWDAYTKPPKWTDYEDALGKYQGAIQKSAFGLKHFAAEIKKAVSDPKRREAITNFIEAAGDRATLEKWAAEAKPKFRAGYKAALTLTNVEQTIARNIIATQDERFELDKAAGLLEHEVENYVMHAWKRENAYTKKLVSNVRAQMLQTKPSFTKKRTFGTFFDGEKAGYAPVNKDIGFLFSAREHAADQAIAARAFIKSMLEGKASDGRPLVAVSGSGRPIKEEDKPAKAYLIDAKTKPEDVADYRSIDHPALRKWAWAQNDSTDTPIYVKGDLVVHPEAFPHLKNVLGKSALRAFGPFHAIQAISSHFKATELSFSMFHQTQESLHAIFHRVNPTSTKPIDFSNSKQQKLIDHGLQVASFDAQQAFGEGLGAGVPNRLPVVGKYLQRYNEYLFGDFIPRLKMALAEHALDRNMERNKKWKLSEDQVYALTANQANSAFGELNYTMMGRNKTMQDVLRMALLAPDFLEARGRFVGQALKPYGAEQATALIVGALGMYVAARILNALLNKGNPHWEPQNVFDVVYKGRAYTLRSVPADLIHLFTDPRGFIYNRLNPVYGRGAVEGITGRDKYGRKQSVGQQVRDTLSGGLPIPIQGLSKGNESGPLETVLSSTGLSTFPYKSPAERLAQRYTLDSMPLGEESKDRKDANHLARELEDKLRKKEISPREVRRQYQEGKITASDRKRILARAARTPLQNSFRSLTPQQAIEVWDKATPDEQKQIRPLLANKLSRLGSVPQNERTKLKERIFTALHGNQGKVSEKGVPLHAPVSR